MGNASTRYRDQDALVHSPQIRRDLAERRANGLRILKNVEELLQGLLDAALRSKRQRNAEQVRHTSIRRSTNVSLWLPRGS